MGRVMRDVTRIFPPALSALHSAWTSVSTQNVASSSYFQCLPSFYITQLQLDQLFCALCFSD